MYIDKAGPDTLLCEFVAGKHRLVHHLSARAYRYVAAFPYDISLADPEGRVLFRDDRDGTPPQPDIDRALYRRGGDRRLLRLYPIRGNDDGHVRQYPHKRDLL